MTSGGRDGTAFLFPSPKPRLEFHSFIHRYTQHLVWNEWTHKHIRSMDRCIWRVLSSCHYWNPHSSYEVKLMQPRREVQFGNKQTTGKLTCLSPHSKKRCRLPSRSLQNLPFAWSQGTPCPLGSNSLLQFLKMIHFHIKQDRSSRCQLSFFNFWLFFFSSWELNKNHILWKLIRRISYSGDLLAQNLVPH